LHLVPHPLVHDALATLRDSSTPPELFRRMAVRISLLLAAEATRDVPSAEVTVETPLGPAQARRITRDVVVVPVLRAGLGMLDAILELIVPAHEGRLLNWLYEEAEVQEREALESGEVRVRVRIAAEKKERLMAQARRAGTALTSA